MSISQTPQYLLVKGITSNGTCFIFSLPWTQNQLNPETGSEIMESIKNLIDNYATCQGALEKQALKQRIYEITSPYNTEITAVALKLDQPAVGWALAQQ
jgi:hypothetical protein